MRRLHETMSSKLVGAVVLSLSLLMFAACGDSGTDPGAGSTTTVTEPQTDPTPSPKATHTGEPVGVTDYEVWFADGENLFPTTHSAGTVQAAGAKAMELLLAGPTAEEEGLGVATLIPDGTELLGLMIAEGKATVDLSSEYESGGGSLSMQMRLAQVVYTLTQFQSVNGVNFKIDGKPVKTFSGEGIVLEKPQTRKDFQDLLPAILVEQPTPGEQVSSPVTVSGTANVFEATVSIRIVDADGNKLKETFTTATCGTGCRGDYSKNVPFQEVNEETEAFIEVYESSAEDGSDTNLVRIPVTLLPN